MITIVCLDALTNTIWGLQLRMWLSGIWHCREEQDALLRVTKTSSCSYRIWSFLKKRLFQLSFLNAKAILSFLDTDEYPRKDASLRVCLLVLFSKDGSVTKGNASGINDGAAAVLIMSAGKS